MRKLIFFILLAVNFVLCAEDPGQIHLLTKSKSFFREQSFHIDFVVENDTQAEITQLAPIADATVELDQQGFTKTGVVHRYKITPHKAGELTIPPLIAKSRDREITSKPLTITVKEPKTHPGVFMHIEVPGGEFYVGQAIPVKVSWYSQLPLYAYRAVDCRAPFFHDSSLRIFESYGSPQGGDNNTIGLPIGQNRIICNRGRAQDEEKNLYDVLSFERTIQVAVPGEYTFKPLTMLASFIPSKVHAKGRRWAPTYPSFFNNVFFEDVDGDVPYEKYLIKSKPVTIKVLDLPKEGRPANFSGIIGPLKMNVSATPMVLHAGDPITLDIDLSGHPFLETLNVDPLAGNRAIVTYFSVNAIQSLPTLSRDKLSITRSIRPISPDTKQIPSLTISYFDPQKKVYKEVKSEPIMLTVKEAEKVTAFDAEINSEEKLTNKIEKNPDGIHHNYSSVDQSNSRFTSPAFRLSIAIIVPVLGFLLFLVITHRSRYDLANPHQAIIRNAYKNFTRQPISDIDSLEKALRRYFAEKLTLPENSHTFEEIELKISQIPGVELKLIKTLYNQSEMQRYNPVPKESENVITADVIAAVKSINRRLKHV